MKEVSSWDSITLQASKLIAACTTEDGKSTGGWVNAGDEKRIRVTVGRHSFGTSGGTNFTLEDGGTLSNQTADPDAISTS